MTYWWLLSAEIVELLISLSGLVLSIVVAREGAHDWEDVKDAARKEHRRVSAEAIDIASERLIMAYLLLFLTFFLTVSGAYAVALVEMTSAAAEAFGKTPLVVQALALRIVLRTGITAVAFVRWKTRAQIRRRLKL